MALAASSFKDLQCPTATPCPGGRTGNAVDTLGEAQEKPRVLVLVAGEVAVQPPAPRPSQGPAPPVCPARPLPCTGVCLLPSSRSQQACEPPVGRDPAVVAPRGPCRAGPGQPPGEMSAQRRCPEARSLARRRKPRSSGMAAAAGVVNQADEQRFLLPGYFTTPGLHHTHPLQEPRGTRTDLGTGWAGSL